MPDTTEMPSSRIGQAFQTTALVSQGGGALGAYQAGVYEALDAAGIELDWVAGISIGAINSALIAGNAPRDRVPRLRHFWEGVTARVDWTVPDWSGDAARKAYNRFSAFSSMFCGQAGFFSPRLPPPHFQFSGSSGALSFYQTDALRQTLKELVDFDLLNTSRTRLSVGAVNVRLGNFVYFDNTRQRIGPEHIMASGALPPGFPAVVIDGDAFWDGGLVSNTPLTQVLADNGEGDTLVFQVDLFSSRGQLPRDLFEVESRRKQIVFSSRTRLNTDHFREMHTLKRAIVELFEAVPPDRRQDERLRLLRDLGRNHNVSIVHLIYRPRGYELYSSDYEFSRASMEEHWQAGFDSTCRSLRSPDWHLPPDPADGVWGFDLDAP